MRHIICPAEESPNLHCHFMNSVLSHMSMFDIDFSISNLTVEMFILCGFLFANELVIDYM